MTVYTLKELHDKRAKLCREIIQLEERTRELRADLAHVEAAIRFLWPGEDAQGRAAPGRAPTALFQAGRAGETDPRLHARAFGRGRRCGGYMPIVTTGRQLNAAEYQRAAIGVYGALWRAERRGIIVREGDGRKAARWRLIY